MKKRKRVQLISFGEREIKFIPLEAINDCEEILPNPQRHFILSREGVSYEKIKNPKYGIPYYINREDEALIMKEYDGICFVEVNEDNTLYIQKNDERDELIIFHLLDKKK